ncbi:hypothetical protein [Actinophytocola sp.]|uniref:hypothetical protein n=1 Tax=Actinophytocola sp. TaxID=1872138 RepID=UPI002ED25FD3
MYEEGVRRVVGAADRIAEYRAELANFADVLAGRGWGSEVSGVLDDTATRLATVEASYREVADAMQQQGDAGAAAHEQAPWVPDEVGGAAGLGVGVAPVELAPGVELTGESIADVAAAVAAAHSCVEPSCDVCAAWRGGYVLVAADLLTTYDEAPVVAQVRAKYARAGRDPLNAKDLDEDRKAWRIYSAQIRWRCRGCNGAIYADGWTPLACDCGSQELDEPGHGGPR